MSGEGIGFAALHRPGRGELLLVAALWIAVAIGLAVASENFGLLPDTWLGPMLLGLLLLFPFALMVVMVWSAGRVLRRNAKGDLAHGRRSLGIHWPVRRSGGGYRGWSRVELGLPRTIADSSLEDALADIPVPAGLIEPERVQWSRPGSILGCLFGGFIGLWFAAGAIGFAMRANSATGRFVAWTLAGCFLCSILSGVLRLPFVHRSRRLPPFLRSIGRGIVLHRPVVIGPGWAKHGRRVWRSDSDLLLIRRRGYRLASAEIECLLVGVHGRRRLTFSGVADDDFRLLLQGWNVAEIRMELIESDLG